MFSVECWMLDVFSLSPPAPRNSTDKLRDGNNHGHAHSLPALGCFRSKGIGNLTRSKCYCNGSAMLTANVVAPSLPLLPPRTGTDSNLKSRWRGPLTKVTARRASATAI